MALEDQVAFRATWSGTHAQTDVVMCQRGLMLVRVDASGHIVERRSSYSEAVGGS